MTENYLHFIWKNNRLPLFDITLKDNRVVTVKNVGVHNENCSGPDFKFGTIKFDDFLMHGHIEMHVKSSDWYRHKHHLDENYNSVILHVVYEYDMDVIQNGYSIPTLELKKIIDYEHFKKYTQQKLKTIVFPCAHQLQKLDPVYFNTMKIKSVTEKLQSKVDSLKLISVESTADVLYNLIGLAFGTSNNKRPFSILLKNVPYNYIKKVAVNDRYDVIMNKSGLLNSPDSVTKSRDYAWNFKGNRPRNFPTTRVSQFAVIVEQFDFEIALGCLPIDVLILTFTKLINNCWDSHSRVQKVASSFVNHLLINAVVPYLWYLGEDRNDTSFQNRALDLLSLLPPEKNNVIRKWERIKIGANDAFDSQALLALHRYYCCHKKCLSCTVGKKVLSRLS